MPNIFKPKRSSTASSVPTTGNLSDGEMAVNLADRKVYVRNGASIVTVADALVDGDKGDVTVSSSGATWTIDSGVVTNAKLANVSTATIKGRTTAGSGSPEDLTGTQATALLDTFTTSLKGLAPASGGGTANFLRADGTWAAPTATVSGNLNVGIVTATSFVRSGGTSTQFLKADGSVDTNTYITSASVGNGTLSLAVSGTGLSGTASFTANQSGNTTFTVTSNATNANTANAIVARDGSGNFIAGIITATTFSGALSGNATSATTATSATSAGSVTNSVTFNNGGAGAASASTFNGSSALTVSYNTIGASPLAGSTSLTTTGTVTTGTWSGSFGAVSGANLTSLTAGNLSGTIPSAVLGNSVHFIGTTSIALNRASASQSLTGVNIDGSSGSCTGNSSTASNLSASATTLATATESNAITISAPSYTTDQPVKLLNFDWYSNIFSLGNIRSGSTPSSGFGVYYTASGGSRTEIARFGTGGTFNTIGAITQNGSQVLTAGNYTTYAAASNHTHGNITNAGAIGSTANLPIITTTSGVLTTGSFGSTANTFCQGNDSRLSDTRNTTNSITFNNGGAGGASASTFNGSAALTVSYNTIGASPLAGSTSLTTTGTVTTGTWSGSFGAVSGANLTSLTAGNLTGTIPSAVLGNSSHFIGTTSIALNRASASQSLTGVNIDGSSGSCTGNSSTATTFSTNRTNYSGVTDGAVAGQLMWKNYGNNHTLFDASAGTSPQGGAVDRFTPSNLVDSATGVNTWGYSINLMGWNGTSTYGVRVDYARAASVLFTARSIGGTSFNGSADITPFRANTIPTIDAGTIMGSSTTYTGRTASSTPQQYAYGVNWEFKNAAAVGGAGNYAGLLTLAPWAGTTASTGDPNYQLAFSPAAANSTAVPTLQMRAGIDATWGSWATILNSSNYTSYAAASNHTHGNITNGGAIGSTANLPIITTTSGLLTTGSFGTAANTFCQGNDSRLSDTRNTTNSITFNNAGTGDASGTTFNGSTARTISHNTIGASPLAGSASLTTTGTVTSGTWSGLFGAVSGANLTNLTAGNLSGTIPSAVLGNSTLYVGTTAIALNRASASQSLTGITDITASGNIAADGAFRAESSNSTERFDIYYNETTDSLDFDYLTV